MPNSHATTPKNKLTRDDILALKDGCCEVFHVRLTRLWDPRPVLIWEGPSQLNLQFGKRGLVAIDAKAYDWAEGCPETIEDNGDIVVEDYLMEIFRNNE